MSSYGLVTAALTPGLVASTVMHTNSTTNGNGTALSVVGSSRAVLSITISGTATVNYEVSPDGGTTWVSILGALVSASSTATSTTSSGCWMFDVGGFSQIRARISGISGGTVNVTGYAAVLSGSGGISSGGGGGNVNLTQINGTTVVAGNGTTGSGSQRVTIASDNTPFPTIVRGDAKGSTSAANATVSSVDADHNALDVYLRGGDLSLGGTTATYMASDVDFAPAASAGDIWTMFGSSSKTVKILYLGLRYTAAGGGTGTFQLTRRSSTSANGTYASPTSVKMDTNNAAASCTIRAYTANPTPGTTVGQLILTTLAPFISFTSSVTIYSPYPEYPLFNYQLAGQPIVLRGTSDGIALSCNGTSPNSSTTKLSLRVIFTEE